MFTPTGEDVARYRRLRAVSRDLNNRMVKTIPKRAFTEIGKALGILRNGVLVLDTEDMSGVMADACLYEWFENDKNLVQAYAEIHPAKPGTDERFLLDAYLQAKYRIIESQELVPGAGLRGRDILNDEDIFLMDLAIGGSTRLATLAMATRTVPLGDYWMTGGAGLPMIRNPKELGLFREMERNAGCGAASLSIIRACLDAGAAKHIRYADADGKAKRREPKHQWRRQ
jgi:hypothetical protein